MIRSLLGVTLLVALVTVVSCDFCNNVTIGSTNGRETGRTAVVPPNVEEYDIQVQPVCPEENIIGLNVNGCNEYNWTLSIKSKNTIHVNRDESPDEIYVKLTVYCNFSYVKEKEERWNHGYYKGVDFKQMANSKLKIGSVGESFKENSSDSKIETIENSFKQNVYYEPRRIRSVKLKNQITSEDFRNKTLENNNSINVDTNNTTIEKKTLEKEKSRKPFKVTKIEKIKKKADKKSNKILQKQIKTKAK